MRDAADGSVNAALDRLALDALALALDEVADRPCVFDRALATGRPTDRLFGPAATLLFRPAGPDPAAAPDDEGPIARAVAEAPAGAVVCLSLGGPPDPSVALWDRMAAARAQQAGLAGGVVDGGRAGPPDGPPVASHGPALTPARGRYGLVARDEPVVLGGVLVRPGDIIVGGAEGLVVVPAERTAAVAARAAAIAREREARLAAFRRRQGREA